MVFPDQSGSQQNEYQTRPYRPSGAAYRFAWNLAGEWDDETWEVYSSANVFAEYDYDHLISRAEEYIASEGLGSTDAHQVMRWVRNLPWRGNAVMLHMGW